MKSKFLLMLLLFTGVMASLNLSAQWTQLGPRIFDPYDSTGSMYINSLCTSSTGQLYAAGRFLNSDGHEFVAKWDGTNWTELGTGANSLGATDYILSICTDAAGNVYAAGKFLKPNSIFAYVAKWDGTTWTELGAGQNMGATFVQDIKSIACDSAGNIYAAGDITDNTAAHYMVTKFDGTNWAFVGALNANATVDQIAIDGNKIYAVGEFTNGSNQYYVAKWDGTTWAELGTASLNAGDYIYTVCVDRAHNVYVGGKFEDASFNEYVAKWDGNTWTELGGPTGFGAHSSGEVYTVTTDNAGNVYAAGGFVDNNFNENVQKWNGSSWSSVGNLNASNFINTVCTYGTKIYAAGAFSNSSFFPYIAEYDLTTGIVTVTNSMFKLYPNPTKDLSSLSFEKATTATITLTDLTGKLLNTWHIENETQKAFNLNGYAAGIYFVKVETTNGEMQTIKIVKQ